MALVRVYCGVATAEMAPWLTVAVVDDAGRLLDMRHISDDPAGYAYLATLLAERAAGPCPVAMDGHEHLVAQLLAAANRPLAIADDMTAHDLAERFADESSYEEMQAPVSQRRAIGLARALQAGTLYASAQSPSWDMDDLKPVLSAHAAVIAGRQASAVTLREVLRELYPAALRAYLDPAEFVPLKILETFPEPGLLTSSPSTRSRETALVAELTSAGVTDASTAVNAIGALRVAVEEARAWNNRLLAPAIAETVRQAVAAVRAADASAAALVGCLAERLGEMTMTNHAPVQAAAPVSPAVPRRAPMPGPAAEVPASRLAPRTSAASAAAAGVGALGLDTMASNGSAYGIPSQRPEQSYGYSSEPSSPAYADSSPAYADSSSGYADSSSGYADSSSGYADSPSAYADSHSAYAGSAYGSPATADYATSELDFPPERYSGYDNGSSYNSSAYGNGSASSNGHGSQSNGYGSAALTGSTGSTAFAAGYAGWEQSYGDRPPSYGPDNLSFSTDPLNAPLDTASVPSPRRAEPDRAIEPAASTNGRVDDDLLIFSQASAWFTNVDVDAPPSEPLNWAGLADDGWRAAEQLAQPSVGPDTSAGLPRRVPQANLVPGSAEMPPSQVRIVRDAKSIAAHTDGYFRGWRRGQEIGGFAVGQRDRAAWEFNREQRARQGAARLS